MTEIEILMLGYQRGDKDATTALIRQVSPLLLRVFLSQCGSRSAAEDLLQDTWLQIHKARHTHRPGEPVLPWIYAIARHVRVDGYRRSQQIRSRERPVSPELKSGDVNGGISDRGPDFDSLIAILPPSQREIVRMLKFSGMSLDEVARATASSVGSVKLKAHRAYEKLRVALSRSVPGKSLRSGNDGL